MISDLAENCINAVLNGWEGLVHFGLKFAEFFNQFGFSFFDGNLYFFRIDVHGSQLFKIILGSIDDHFKGLNFMIFMTFIIANTTNDTVFDAFGFKAYDIKNLTNMVASFFTLRILEMLEFRYFSHCKFCQRYFS